MATGDFADLYNAAARLGRRDVTVATEKAIVQAMVNEANSTIQTSRWIAPNGMTYHMAYAETLTTFSTVIGQESYTFATVGGATTINDVVHLSVPGQRNIEWTPYDEYARGRTTLAGANAFPEWWTQEGRANVLLYPKPDAAYTVNALCIVQPVDLVNDADVPTMPLPYRRRVLVHYAAMRLLEEEAGQATPESQWCRQQFEEALQELRLMHGAPDPLIPMPMVVPKGVTPADGTFLDLAQKAVREAGLKEWVTSDVQRARDAINEAYMALVDDSTLWQFLRTEGTITLAAGTNTRTYDQIATDLGLTPPVTISEILDIADDTNGRLLTRVDWQGMEDHFPTTGYAPTYNAYATSWWARWNRTVRFYPRPTAAPTLRFIYIQRPGPLVLDTDTTVLPLRWAERIFVPWAAWMMISRPNPAEAPPRSRWEAMYKMSLVAAMQQRYTAGLNDFRNQYGYAHEPMLDLAQPGAFDDWPDIGMDGFPY